MTSIDAADQPFIVTHGRILAIAVPMTLAHLTEPLLGMAGTIIIGQLGQAHLLGAVAMSAVVFDSIFWLFGFLSMSTTALTAQALGAGDATEQRAALTRALLLAAVCGLLLIILQVPVAWVAYRAMGASEAVTGAAEAYFHVRIWSAPLTLANYVVFGWLIGLARAGTNLALQLLVNVVNIAASAWFVLGLDLDVTGAAAATILAEAAGLIAGLIVAFRVDRGWLRPPASTLFDRAQLKRIFVVNGDIMIRTATMIVVFTFFTAQGARQGDTMLAANAVLNNLTLIGAYFLDGFATAAQQLCGRAVGAHDRSAFSRAVRFSLTWALAFAFASSAVFIVAGNPLIALMTTSPEVREASARFLVFAALGPLAGVLAYAYDGIYSGATWTRDLRNLMIAAVVIYFAGWWALTGFGNAGLWVSFMIFLAVRGLLQAARYPALERATFSPATARP